MQFDDIFSIADKIKWNKNEFSVWGEEKGYQFTLQQDDHFLYLYINLPTLTKPMVKIFSSYIMDVAEDWQIVKSFYKNSTFSIVFYAAHEPEVTHKPENKRFINVDEPKPISAEIFKSYIEQLAHFMRDNGFRNDICVFCGSIEADEQFILNGFYSCAHKDCAEHIEAEIANDKKKLSFGKGLLGVLGSIVGALVGAAVFVALSKYYPILAGGAGYLVGWLSYSLYKAFTGKSSSSIIAVSSFVSVIALFAASFCALYLNFAAQITIQNDLVQYARSNPILYYIMLNFVIGLFFIIYGIYSTAPTKESREIFITRPGSSN